MDCLVVTPHRYGIREVAERIGTEWERLGHGVEYVLAEGAAANVGPVTVGTPGIAIWWYRTLKRVAPASEYDLVWLHQPLAPRLPTADPTFWNRTVVTFHTTMAAEYRLARRGIYPWYLRPFHRLNRSIEARFYRALAASDADPTYTVVAPHLREEIEPFGAEGAAHVPNGVPGRDPERTGPIRAEYGVPEGATLVVNVAKMYPQKRPAELAAVMAEVIEGEPTTHFVMAGDGPLRSAVERNAGDRFHVPGHVGAAEKWRLLADADAFVSLSAYEGMPVASAEALSVGVPVVLSDIPAHRNLIEDHEATGELVDVDADAVRAALGRLAGRQAAASLPDWGTVAESYLEVGGRRSGRVAGESGRTPR
jgi:glycosyltransferase involved in cell wall biosynthesis